MFKCHASPLTASDELSARRPPLSIGMAGSEASNGEIEGGKREKRAVKKPTFERASKPHVQLRPARARPEAAGLQKHVNYILTDDAGAAMGRPVLHLRRVVFMLSLCSTHEVPPPPPQGATQRRPQMGVERLRVLTPVSTATPAGGGRGGGWD